MTPSFQEGNTENGLCVLNKALGLAYWQNQGLFSLLEMYRSLRGTS